MTGTKMVLLVAFLLLVPSFALAQSFTRITVGAIVNDGGGSFCAAWGDYDNDGDLDLFVSNAGEGSNSKENNFLYRNNGDGTFERVTAGAIFTDAGSSVGSSWGDYDNDGDLDLFVANFWGENNFLYRNDGEVTGGGQVIFTSIASGAIANDGGSSHAGCWADYDNDGDLDLFVTNSYGENNFLYRNNGNGTFNRVSAGAIVNDSDDSFGASWADYDNDGDLDLFVANGAFTSGQKNNLYQNNGDGTFTKVTIGDIISDFGISWSGSWGDYDNDGDLDLFVANDNGQSNFLYRNDRAAGFHRITNGAIVNDGGSSRGGSWGDYDNDGDLDLFVANASGSNFMYENNGNGSFKSIRSGDIVSFASGGSGGMSWGDYDRDGDLDLFVANLGDNNFLLRNDGNENSWVNIRCVGTVSNSSAIGARVSVLARINGVLRWQMREISGGELSQNSLNAEFGLGNATVIDSIRIRWPSGAIQDTANVAVNQFLTIIEPQFVRITAGEIATDVGRSAGVSWGDFDNDGHPDLFVANSAGENNFLYRNQGDGTFTRILSGAIVSDGGSSQSATWGDYDNDGNLDLFVANLGNNFLYQNNGDGTFSKITGGDIVNDGGNSKGSSWGDFDNDGKLDLFVANDHESNFLYRNNGDGTFHKITDDLVVTDRSDSFGGSWIDYDNDGDLDLFVTNIGNNALYENNGDGTFKRISDSIIARDGETSQGSSWSDYDNDGDLDVFVANFGRDVLYRNDGAGPSGELRFTVIFTGGTVDSRGSSWGDFDNDGDPDLFVSTGGNNVLYRNDGRDNFTPMTTAAIDNDGGNSLGAAWADYDNNGLLDLFVGNSGISNFLYKTGGTGNHWLNILLKGRTSNASGIGARVSLSAIMNGFPVRQMQEISAQTGYLSQNSLNAEFGIGDAAVVDSIRIVWPSGAVNTYFDIRANQFLIYEENNRPRVENVIPTITLNEKNNKFTRDLLAAPAIFSDADGDTLAFRVEASDSTIVAATLSGNRLTISLRDPRAAGKASVTLHADDGRVDDGRGDTETAVIEVNRPPLILREISTRIFGPGSTAPFVEDLSAVFLDPDVGSNVIFRVTNPDSTIAIATVDGRILTIARGDSSGQVAITLVADDTQGGTAMTRFTVRNVLSNPNRPRVIASALADTTLVLSGLPFRQNLNAVFTDDDGDVLSFSASSSPQSVAFAGITEDTLLVVNPLSLGQALITVRANDGLGGEASTQFRVEVLLSLRPIVTHTPAAQPQPLGQSISIEAEITDDEVAVTDAFLHYRVAGAANFEISPMQLSGFGIAGFLATGTIPGTAVTARGVEYFITAQDRHGVQSKPDTISVLVRVDGDGLRKGSPQPGGDAQTSYRLISIPLDADNESPESILADDLGRYDPTRWRLYQWAALPDGGVVKGEFTSASETFDLSPGTALWLIVKDANKVIDSGPGVTVSTAAPFQKSVNKGWNLIGNPFNYPTILADTLSDGSPLALYSYENGEWSDELRPNSTLLQPFSGYAVLAGSASNLFIKTNPHDGAAGLPKLQGDEHREPLWSLRIRAQCQRARDGNNIVAVVRDAARDWDHWDSPEPPGIGEYVSVYFPHPEWNTLSKRFSADFRPEPDDGEEWTLEIETNIRDVVLLTFEGLESVPAAYEVWLVDKALRVATDLRQQKTYSVAGRSPNHPKQLSLIVGKPGYLTEKFTQFQEAPADYDLSQNFPNPFNPVTTIRYALPNSDRVTLRVYDILGKTVVTLVDNELKELGYHVAVWNGRNAAGKVVASGVYFVRMQAGNFVRTGKMVLIE